MTGNQYEEYLGDGVYASFDGFHIWLDTRAQEPVNRIALDPHVRLRFSEYIEMLKKKRRGALARQAE